jgi:hypothetical protein
VIDRREARRGDVAHGKDARGLVQVWMDRLGRCARQSAPGAEHGMKFPNEAHREYSGTQLGQAVYQAEQDCHAQLDQALIQESEIMRKWGANP